MDKTITQSNYNILKGVFDEMMGPEKVRPHYEKFKNRLPALKMAR